MPSQNLFENLINDFISKSSIRNFPIGIEIRNPNYLNKKYFELLEQLKIIPVMLEGYYMPSVVETCGKHLLQNPSTVVFRLHGPDRTGIEKISSDNWNQIYIDRTQELEKLSDLFRDFLTRQVDLFINVNNHYEGSAPLTIQKIKKMMQM
jgi:uncharacterized protein YecE (DUF72 family)